DGADAHAFEPQLQRAHLLGRSTQELLRLQRDGSCRARDRPGRDDLHVHRREGQPEPRGQAVSAGRGLPVGRPAPGDASMRFSRWMVLWLGIVVVLVGVEIGVVTGYITPAGLISSFLTLIIGVVVISVFAFIGAVFLGMF